MLKDLIKLDFKKVELSDAEALASAFERYKGRICDYSAGNAVFWRDYYDTSFHLDENGLILRFGDMDGEGCFSFPISDEPFELIDSLIENIGASLCLTCLTEEQYEAVKSRYDVEKVIYSEDWDDYLYNAEDMVNLRGRKYNGQRNHINKFKKLYPDYRFETINADNAETAKEFTLRFFHSIGKRNDVSDIEEKQLTEQFENWEIYKQHGGILFIGDSVVGISVGELVGDTLIIHTEKADTSYEGAYPMLTNCFAKAFAADERCKYINREEDCGEEGLRISKRSYHPVQMIKKYSAIINFSHGKVK